MRICSLTLALAFVTCGAAGLHAQSAADEAILSQLDAAVGADPLPDLPRAEDPVARQVQEGLVELDRYVDHVDRNALERALFRFNQASARRPDWSWPEYAMARAFLALHRADAPLLESAGAKPGERHIDAMWRHLLEALERDRAMVPARRLLLRFAYPSGDRELRPDMREALALEAANPDATGLTLVAWARHHRTGQRYDSTLALLERAERAGADHGVIALETARTLWALGERQRAVERYWDGLHAITPLGRSLYRADLEWIVSSDSLAAFDAVPDDSLASWLRRFWGERDAASVGMQGDRLREHLRRWVHAHERFRIPSPWQRTLYTRVDIGFDGQPPPPCVETVARFYERLPIKPPTLPDDLREPEPLLDHRGLLYLRHGDPFAQIVPASIGELLGLEEADFIPKDQYGQMEAEASIARTVIWIYWLEGAWRVFSLRGSNALGSHAPTTLSSYLRGNADTWRALARVVPSYGALASRLLVLENRLLPPRFPATCELEFRTALKQLRADANIGIDTDSDLPPMVAPWNAALRFFAVGHAADANGRTLITFAIPIRDLTADSLQDGRLLWPVTFHIVAFRHRDGARVTLDTTRQFITTTVPEGGNLSGTFELPLADGTWQLAVLARQRADTLGGAYALHRRVVVDGGAGLALTDIVTGREGQPGWRAPDGSFPVNTLGAWPERGTVELWYEVRGVPEGEEYHTTVQVLPGEERLRRDISVRVTDRSPGGTVRVRRTLGLENLDSGRYRLVVTIEHGGTTVSREQEILVVKGEG